MQGITRRGHLALAGLLGVLIGVLVVVSWASPASTSARPAQAEPAKPVADAANATGPALPGRLLHDALAAKQAIEAELYPVRIADVSAAVNAKPVTPGAGPLGLQAALRAKQQAEEEAYPSRILFPGRSHGDPADAAVRALQKNLLDKQRVEAEYFPGH